MTIKELHTSLQNMMESEPKCIELPIALSFKVGKIDSRDCPNANFWLSECELHNTGQSGYEIQGELTLIGEE